MSDARYHCCDLKRRNAVAAHPVLNGIDALEVIDRDLPQTDPLRQRTLLVFFLKSVAAAGFAADNVRIAGGERVPNPRVDWAGVASLPLPLADPSEAATAAIIGALPNKDRVLVVRVAEAGDYSPYELSLVQGLLSAAPPVDFDPRLTRIEFSFKAECPSDFDCREQHVCPPAERSEPDIDYLARDYGTFRRLMLDRMAQQVPDWKPRSIADTGVALIELLAYVGDHLSYRQDAIATEAYLGTARSRISTRRHAELVDYQMHDGCNARTFVFLELAAAMPSLGVPRIGTRFLTRCDRTDVHLGSGSSAAKQALDQRPIVFEPMKDVTLYSDHNRLTFHTWSDEQCCLVTGATRATLRGEHPNLAVGDYLLFEEVRGPRTGAAGDADPTHRQVVRLTKVWLTADPLPPPPPAPQVPVPITEIEWAAADRLTFPLCLSATRETAAGIEYFTDVSVARGNIVPADHGHTQDVEDLPKVPPGRVLTLPPGEHCAEAPRREVPSRYRPRLSRDPVTQAAPLIETSAREAMRFAAAKAVPQISLKSTFNGVNEDWEVRRTLLDSDANARNFVVEVESSGEATLRFGNGTYGERPAAEAEFKAVYRVGNGTGGNVGAEALAHVIGVDVTAIATVRNPLPACLGEEPESIESVRRRAPQAFRRQERAVTPADYVEVTERLENVENAAARLRWTGSWHTMFVTVDQSGGEPLDKERRDEVTRHLDGFRMAGHDLDIEEPDHVSLALSLHVCVEPDYFRSDVEQGLLDLFSAGQRRDGRRGLFHPDAFSFRSTVYLSPLLAAARDVPGVASVAATVFGRQGDEDTTALDEERLRLGPRQIARLDNNPNFPERGVLTLELHGGK